MKNLLLITLTCLAVLLSFTLGATASIAQDSTSFEKTILFGYKYDDGSYISFGWGDKTFDAPLGEIWTLKYVDISLNFDEHPLDSQLATASVAIDGIYAINGECIAGLIPESVPFFGATGKNFFTAIKVGGFLGLGNDWTTTNIDEVTATDVSYSFWAWGGLVNYQVSEQVGINAFYKRKQPFSSDNLYFDNSIAGAYLNVLF